MQQTINSIFGIRQPSDVVDILLVSLAFFLLFTIFRQSRSPVALRGLILASVVGFGIYLLAQTMRLDATRALFEKLWLVGTLVFLICFQNELKKALTDIGRRPLFQTFLFKTRVTAIEELIVAASRLSEKKIGGLLCIERRNPLRAYAETGTRLDAEATAELLRTIFAPYTPLHDGAVILRNNRIAAAGCLLPLSESQSIPKDLGTRHRAALGLSEETDAVVIVISEETGTISLVHEGRIERPETPESLRAKLRSIFELGDEEESGDER